MQAGLSLQLSLPWLQHISGRCDFKSVCRELVELINQVSNFFVAESSQTLRKIKRISTHDILLSTNKTETNCQALVCSMRVVGMGRRCSRRLAQGTSSFHVGEENCIFIWNILSWAQNASHDSTRGKMRVRKHIVKSAEASAFGHDVQTLPDTTHWFSLQYVFLNNPRYH